MPGLKMQSTPSMGEGVDIVHTEWIVIPQPGAPSGCSDASSS